MSYYFFTGFGLKLFFRMVSKMTHDSSNIWSPLELNKRLDKLRKNIDDGPYFENLIQK